jgi:AcrR family transcriptional regulator
MTAHHPIPPRERILEAAARLFHEEGIRGVGVEAIAAEAATTKMAIYRAFGSKDALVAEWVRALTRQYAAVLDGLAERHPGNARAQLLGFVDFIIGSLYTVSHRGCPFVNSIAELPERSHEARQLIEAHKARQAARLAVLCRQAGIPEPREAAAELTLVLEGAQITALNRGIPNVDRILKRLALRIIDRGVPSPVPARRRAAAGPTTRDPDGPAARRASRS